MSSGRLLDRILVIVLATLFGVGVWEHYATTNRANRLARQAKALAVEGAQAHEAICVLRHDLELRIVQSQEFLLSHPGGFAGIPASVIRDSIRNQQATVRSLSVIRCLAS